jgi:hypothetical protein
LFENGLFEAGKVVNQTGVKSKAHNFDSSQGIPLCQQMVIDHSGGICYYSGHATKICRFDNLTNTGDEGHILSASFGVQRVGRWLEALSPNPDNDIPELKSEQ